MKTELEPQDIQAIAAQVVEALKPHLATAGKEEDTVLDKETLAAYLHVDVSWINRQITDRAIPYIKMGKYTRFRKSHIDRWLDGKKIETLSAVKNFRKRGQVL